MGDVPVHLWQFFKIWGINSNFSNMRNTQADAHIEQFLNISAQIEILFQHLLSVYRFSRRITSKLQNWAFSIYLLRKPRNTDIYPMQEHQNVSNPSRHQKVVVSLLNLPGYSHFSCLENFKHSFWKIMIFAVVTLFFWGSDMPCNNLLTCFVSSSLVSISEDFTPFILFFNWKIEKKNQLIDILITNE